MEKRKVKVEVLLEKSSIYEPFNVDLKASLIRAIRSIEEVEQECNCDCTLALGVRGTNALI